MAYKLHLWKKKLIGKNKSIAYCKGKKVQKDESRTSKKRQRRRGRRRRRKKWNSLKAGAAALSKLTSKRPARGW
eukprot:6181146-Pleurochrysis_carterae.AAC.4